MPNNQSFGTFPYTIQSGDTFFKLAQQYNTTANDLALANPGVDSNNLTLGQNISLPMTNPAAIADIKGGPLRPQISGVVRFLTHREAPGFVPK
ncbi:hypothetical protein N752_15885 [Desulforamulus aquiferis]|nr:LysM domain-containing protein [Desulforamulus aquiferis]RYD04323.1 hypothetical protein N752_15885 [Desulforamulus aquiferis]